MPDYHELEERLTKVEVKVNRQQVTAVDEYDKLHELTVQLDQLKNKVSDLAKRITELEQEEGESTEEFLRQDEMLVRCGRSKNKREKYHDEIRYQLADKVLEACCTSGEDGTFTMKDLEENEGLKGTGEKRPKFDIALSWLKSMEWVEEVEIDGTFRLCGEVLEVNDPFGLLRGAFNELPEFGSRA